MVILNESSSLLSKWSTCHPSSSIDRRDDLKWMYIYIDNHWYQSAKWNKVFCSFKCAISGQRTALQKAKEKNVISWFRWLIDSLLWFKLFPYLSILYLFRRFADKLHNETKIRDQWHSFCVFLLFNLFPSF